MPAPLPITAPGPGPGFEPDAAVVAALLDAFTDPAVPSINDIARALNVSLPDLALFFARPDIRATHDSLSSLFARRARFLAATRPFLPRWLSADLAQRRYASSILLIENLLVDAPGIVPDGDAADG